MGDGADYAIETGMMAELDGEFDDEPNLNNYSGRSNPITCKFCGEKGFNWGQHEGKWRLFRGTKLHTCAPKGTFSNKSPVGDNSVGEKMLITIQEYDRLKHIEQLYNARSEDQDVPF